MGTILFWVEASMPLKMLSSENTEVGLSIGGGNGSYTTDTDPMVASVSIDVSNDDWFGSYILNPYGFTPLLVVMAVRGTHIPPTPHS